VFVRMECKLNLIVEEGSGDNVLTFIGLRFSVMGISF
jgi:hypothetical protein